MTRYIVFVLCLMVLACSPEKRLQKLLKKHPELLNKVDTVTVVRTDTITIDGIAADTMFHASVDSIIIIKDKLRIVYRKIRDSIYIKGEYLGDTIVRIDTVRIEVKIAEVRKPTLWEEVRGWLWLVILIVLGLVFRKALKKLVGL